MTLIKLAWYAWAFVVGFSLLHMAWQRWSGR